MKQSLDKPQCFQQFNLEQQPKPIRFSWGTELKGAQNSAAPLTSKGPSQISKAFCTHSDGNLVQRKKVQSEMFLWKSGVLLVLL